LPRPVYSWVSRAGSLGLLLVVRTIGNPSLSSVLTGPAGGASVVTTGGSRVSGLFFVEAWSRGWFRRGSLTLGWVWGFIILCCCSLIFDMRCCCSLICDWECFIAAISCFIRFNIRGLLRFSLLYFSKNTYFVRLRHHLCHFVFYQLLLILFLLIHFWIFIYLFNCHTWRADSFLSFIWNLFLVNLFHLCFSF